MIQTIGAVRSWSTTFTRIAGSLVASVLLASFPLPTVVASDTEAPQFSTAGFYAVDGSPRKVFNFNPGWRFLKGDAKNAAAEDFDDTQWEAASTPHGLEILGENASGGRNYQGIAWYRKKFMPQVTDGRRTVLYFEAVMGESRFYVNGQKVADHYGGYLPVAIDVTDYLHTDGASNTVAVMAENSDSKRYPPGKAQAGLDFTYMGGIYRDVWLIQTGDVHVSLRELSDTVAGGGVFAATLDVNPDDRTATVAVRTEVANDGMVDQQLTVTNTMLDAEGNAMHTISNDLDVAAGSRRQVDASMALGSVNLWHPDAPNLHFIHTEVTVSSSGQVMDSLRTRLGIRLLEMRGAEGLFINKKWIGKKLIGANRHQDYAHVGNALPNSGQWRDVKLLREGGCNIIRAGHYPQDPAFYDACDQFGMLTTTANPGWHFFNFKEKVFEDRLYDDTRQLVRRDRGVASMLMWETAINEFPRQPDYAMNTMHRIAHEEFPFPGMFTVADHDEAKKGGLDIFYHGDAPDVNSFNREYGDGNEVDDWYSQNARTRVKMEWGEGPLLRQAMIQAATLSDRYPTPKVRLGGALWCGIDHHRGYHPDPFRGGLLNQFRIPRYTYRLYQSQYDPDFDIPGIGKQPMVFSCNELTQLSPERVVVFSNCDQVQLIWRDKTFGPIGPSRDARFQHLPHPPFIFEDVFDFIGLKQRGKSKLGATMVIEGLIGGKVAASQSKPYAQRTTGLTLSVADEGISLTADGSDFVPLRAAVVDQFGTPKVLASEDVRFVVQGPAEVVGEGLRGLNPAATSYGVATALIRASTTPGTIKVTAYSDGLESASVTLDSQPGKLPMLFDEPYVRASRKPAPPTVTVVAKKSDDDLPSNVKSLQEELKRLRLEVIGKDQDIMELRSRLGTAGD